MTLEQANIPYPKTFCSPMTFHNIGYTTCDFLKAPEQEFGYPYVIKEEHGRAGEECSLVYSREKAEKIVKNMSSKRFVMQEFCSYKPGYMIRVNIVNGEPAGAMEQINHTDWRSNLHGNHEVNPIEITEEMKNIAIAAAKACDCNWAGIDLIYDNNGHITVCEVNANPHFKKTMEVSHINLADRIIKMILHENELMSITRQ